MFSFNVAPINIALFLCFTINVALFIVTLFIVALCNVALCYFYYFNTALFAALFPCSII